MTDYYKSFIIIYSLVLSIVLFNPFRAISQSISGQTVPVANINYTYNLSGSYSNVTWQATNGTVVSYTSTQAVIRFNQPSGGPTSYGTGQVIVKSSGSPLSTLNVNVAPGLSAATLSASATSVTPGSSANLIVNVTYGGSSGAFTYQWQVSYNAGSTWQTLTTNNNTYYTLSSLTYSALYRVVVAGGTVSVTTNTVQVNVVPALVAGSLSPDVTAGPYGGNSIDTLIAQPSTGGSGTIVYQWQDSVQGGSWTNIPGATSLKYLPTNLTQITGYRLVSTDGSGQTVYSIVSRVYVLEADPTTLSGSYNYIVTQIAKAPETDANILSERPLRDAPMTVQYFDGLGRPLEIIKKKGSLKTSTGTSGDLVSLGLFDGYGRDSVQFLPYVATTADGSYKTDALTAQPAFYNNTNSPDSGQGETGANAHTLTVYEASPLSRVMENFAPGNSWLGTASQTTENNRHSVKQKYWSNTAVDSVRVWLCNFPAAGSWGSYTSTTMYATGTLYKSVTVDEAGHQVIEFRNEEGQVVLKKVQLTATADAGAGSGHTGWLCTYYIYDDLGNLRCVVQPEGVKWLAANSWNLTDATVLAEQCFRYEYDGRNQMIMKQVPGAGAVYMVYDARNRLVMSQDANLRSKSLWIATKYDTFNRPDTTWQDSLPGAVYSTILTQARASSNYPTGTITSANLLTATHYDDYTDVAFPTGVSGTYKSTWNGYYLPASTNTFPYAETPAQNTTVTTKGLVTWTQARVLNSNPVVFITTVNIYDDKGRVIQTQSNNITGGANVNTTQYSWAGQPLITVNWQSKLGTRPDTSITVTKLTYDNLNRLVKTEMKQSNSKVRAGAMPTNYITLSQIQYDAIGQVKAKYLGDRKTNDSTYNTTPLEKQYYEYNVRGWLLGVNRAYARDAASTDSTTTTTTTQTMGGEMFTEGMTTLATVTYPSTNYFGFDLGYDKTNNNLIRGKTYTAAQYTGNITGMVWKGANDKKARIYNFTYDNTNRLTAANFGQYASGGFSSANVNYTVNNLTYDNNGNIKTMNQYGLKTGSTSAVIDQLSYDYTSGSNKLLNVIDAANDPASTLGDYHYSGTKTTATVDYEYDANGNLHLDHSKHLTITYNYLNLPQSIAVTDKGTITYVYDAGGNKLKKVTVDNTVTPALTTTTLYLGGSVYQNDTLQFFGTSEGRVRPNTANSAFAYDYFLKDHLGNTRMVLTDDYNVASPILEATSYYPFGLQQRGISLTTALSNQKNKYLFNGDELQSQEFSDGSGLELYDATHRMLDPQLGRFFQHDALSMYTPNQSPYPFVQDNPILFMDPSGLDTVRISGAGHHQVKISNGDVLAVTVDGSTGYYNYKNGNYTSTGEAESTGDIPTINVTAKADKSADEPSSMSMYEFAGRYNFGVGTGASIMEGMSSTFRLTNGIANGSRFAFKYYGSGWGGGSRALIKTYKFSEAGHILGRVSFGVGVAFDGYGVYKYYTSGANDPNAVSPGKAGLNTTMGAYGLWVDPVVGIAYFGMDAFYPGGWGGDGVHPGALQDQLNNQREIDKVYNTDPTKPRIYLAPNGADRWGGP